jgi:hypothetical protein
MSAPLFQSGGSIVPVLNSAGKGYYIPGYELKSNVAAEAGDYTANNLVRVLQVVLPFKLTVGHISMNVTTGVNNSSTIDVGLYNAAGSLLVNAGGFNANTNGVKTATPTPVTINPQVLYFAWTANTSGTVGSLGHEAIQLASLLVANLFGVINLNGVRYGTAANSATAGVLPATLSTLTAVNSAASYPPFALFEA